MFHVIINAQYSMRMRSCKVNQAIVEDVIPLLI